MKDYKLIAEPREEKGYKVRRGDYIPAILYGKHIESTSVQFSKNELNTITRKLGDRARIKIGFGDNESLGIFKEVSRDIITREILHLDIQLVDLKDEMTITVPIVLHGTDALTFKKLVMQQSLSEVQLTGRVDLIPNTLEVDVSGMEDGDTKVLGDVEIPEGVKYLEDAETLIVSARVPKMTGAEEAEEAEEAGEVAEAGEAAPSESTETEE